MTASRQASQTCNQVLADDPRGPRECRRKIGPSGARGMCPAHYRAALRREKAAAEGRELATYRAGEPQATITISLPRSMAARLDKIAGRRRRSAMLRRWIEDQLGP